VGVFFLAIGINGLQQLGAPFYASPLFNGSALLIAVSLTFVLARRTQEADQ
jgi:ribose transport system permease protein